MLITKITYENMGAFRHMAPQQLWEPDKKGYFYIPFCRACVLYAVIRCTADNWAPGRTKKRIQTAQNVKSGCNTAFINRVKKTSV